MPFSTDIHSCLSVNLRATMKQTWNFRNKWQVAGLNAIHWSYKPCWFALLSPEVGALFPHTPLGKYSKQQMQFAEALCSAQDTRSDTAAAHCGVLPDSLPGSGAIIHRLINHGGKVNSSHSNVKYKSKAYMFTSLTVTSFSMMPSGLSEPFLCFFPRNNEGAGRRPALMTVK